MVTLGIQSLPHPDHAAMPLLSPLVVAAFLALGAIAGQTASPSPEDVASELQKKYDAIRDFSADFVQHHESSVLKRKREERGTLLVKKPGKMRWQYKGPDEKVFVSDGVRMIQYLPLENRAIVGAAPSEDQVAVFFLAGRGHITRDFNVSFAQGAPAGDTWTLRLEPKRPQQEYDWLEVTVDRKTLRIQAFTVAEKQGSRSTFTLSNFKENPGLADKAFEFSIPRGAEVSNAGPVKR
jgi:outer membrane lipoprotein carrier protein